MIEISFIIPVYKNTLEEIHNCIESIKKQNIEKYEIIVINDGSNDKDIENYFLKNHHECNSLVYLSQKNYGSAVARNNGLKKAKGEYIFFVDSDDQLADNFYFNFKKIKKQKIDIMIFDYSNWNQEGENFITLNQQMNFNTKKEVLFSSVMFNNAIYNGFMFGAIWGKCFKRIFLERNNLRFRDKLRKAQDRMFMLECYFYAQKIEYFPIQEYRYRINDNSICRKMNLKMIDYYYELFIEMSNFCIKNNISTDSYKYLTYGIVSEMLPLTIFHIDNEEKYKEKKNFYREISIKFKFKRNLEKMNFKDFDTLTRKIKFFLYKHHLFSVLYIYFHLKQKKDRKKSFKK
ncbi:MAG: glycosyltransferase [Bacilli bacterium]|nr:glycosyltransferase [Bacilli bacterium]